MRIVFLTPRFPYPLFKGDQLRAYYQIKYLSERHDIHLLSLVEQGARPNLEALKPYCNTIETISLSATRIRWNLSQAVFSFQPFQSAYYFSPKMMAHVAHAVDKIGCDLLYVQLVRMAPYGATITGVPKVIDIADAFSANLRRSLPYQPLWRRPIVKLEYRKVQRAEREALVHYDGALFCTLDDRDAVINSDGATQNLFVSPSGIECDQFAPQGFKKEGHRLLFEGNIDYFPNRDAALHLLEDIFPRVRQRFPSAELYIVGINNVPAIWRHHGRGNVVVTGFVEDVRPYYHQADLFVNPLRVGAGIQTKIRQALAAGTPVVCSTLANNGIQATHGYEVVIADEPGEFADVIVELLQTPERPRELAQRGLEFVKARYDWRTIIATLDDYLENVHRSFRPHRTESAT